MRKDPGSIKFQTVDLLSGGRLLLTGKAHLILFSYGC
jgi:hypothetical protein